MPMMRAALCLLAASAARAQPTMSEPGTVMKASGTTNPKKLHWELMSKMEAMSPEPIDLTYRGVGSSSGKKEFLAQASDWGCAEIPVYTSDTKPAGSTVLQFPLVLGAMSAFHSIPKAIVGAAGLDLTPCMLAAIFSGEITRWDDAKLRADSKNPGLANVAQNVTVFHRTKGSSTTNFFTRYLWESTRANAGNCASSWPHGYGPALTTDADIAGTSTATKKWTQSAHFKPVQGSGMMSSSLSTVPYGIGYIDSGHGHEDGLSEIKLKNADGNYLDSKDAGDAGVMSAMSNAMSNSNFPKSSAGDWGVVDLINEKGAKTWPIVAISYMLAYQNMTSTNVGELSKAYFKLAMDAKYGGQKLAPKYKFTPLPAAIVAMNLKGVDSIVTGEAWPYQFEFSTNTTSGPLPRTMSVKRESYERYTLDAHDKILKAITGDEGLSLLGDEAFETIHAKLASTPMELHGSGTTNPSKMVWKMIGTMKGMAARPLHISYRAIGSSTGIAEFVAGKSDFGMAEIPLSPADITKMGQGPVLQVPLVLGAMSAFHSVPLAGLGGGAGAKLRLSPCTLGGIFARKILTWNDPKILADNTHLPGLKNVANKIVMLHRKSGSSTTNFFTRYLDDSTKASNCAAMWDLGWGAALTTSADVAKYPTAKATWAADSATVKTCQGSGMMSSTLAGTAWAVGYIDSGHGHDDGLSEVQLKNKDGMWVDSKQVGSAGVTAAAAAAKSQFPSTSTGDWSSVNLLNQAGKDTWPIVAMSYTFVKADLTSMGNKGALLKAYMEYTQSNEKGYGAAKGAQQFCSAFSFSPLPAELTTIAAAGIKAIKLAPTAPAFQWEWSTDKTGLLGVARNTLSCKRADYAAYVAHSVPTLASAVAKVEAKVQAEHPEEMSASAKGMVAAAKKESGNAMGMAIAAICVAAVSLLLNVYVISKLSQLSGGGGGGGHRHESMDGKEMRA